MSSNEQLEPLYSDAALKLFFAEVNAEMWGTAMRNNYEAERRTAAARIQALEQELARANRIIDEQEGNEVEDD